jgi:hypothetical protein
MLICEENNNENKSAVMSTIAELTHRIRIFVFFDSSADAKSW